MCCTVDFLTIVQMHECMYSGNYISYFMNKLVCAINKEGYYFSVEGTIRLEIVTEFPINSTVISVATLKDEIFMLCVDCSHSYDDYTIYVYDRNSMSNVKDVIPLKDRPTNPSSMSACNVANCLYIDLRSIICCCFSVFCHGLKITGGVLN